VARAPAVGGGCWLVHPRRYVRCRPRRWRRSLASTLHGLDGQRPQPSPRPGAVATMFRIRTFICILLASAFTAGAGAGPALASHGETTYFEGSSELLSGKTREHAISQLQQLGVRALRVELYWVNVAPSPKRASPPRFDATNPASYNWGAYDWLLSKAKQLHWQVLLTVTGPV